ncbi:MAG: hypothetical protein JWM88_2841 [Verrucomicrobia bacterium]|nr:hypothetical protein [Verrucomicrobiota bacterium]
MMNHRAALGLVGLICGLAVAWAEEPFSKAIRPEDFAAAELDKLSPEALARLDGLVQAYKSGAVATARAEAETQAARQAAAREKELARAQEKTRPASPGFFAKAKVRLTPGTEVEYGEIESRIAGTFTGWSGSTIFTLENGQRWKVANGGEYYSTAVKNPGVKVYPAGLGGFWMQIEGVGPRVRVKPVGK